ncbi:hypothetical protein AB0I81_34855 [Nonomuraea sp. NPDC050404]|uniref:hypothetical protein n=1 Tax=Nonomuraea sp. NPDC050404 TaxID=3155783 RepID=UPI0033F6D1A6
MTTLTESWAEGRASRAKRPACESILSRAARHAGRILPTWRRARTFVLQVGGLGLIDYALWELHVVAGIAAAGVSLLLLEWAGRDA